MSTRKCSHYLGTIETRRGSSIPPVPPALATGTGSQTQELKECAESLATSQRLSLLVLPTTAHAAEAESSALHRYCVEYGVIKEGGTPCTEMSSLCDKSQSGMPNERACAAADIITCWYRGIRPGAKFDACMDQQAKTRQQFRNNQ